MPSRASVFEGLHLPSCQTEDSVSLGGGGGGKTGWCSQVFTRAGVGGGVGGLGTKLKKDKGHYTGRLTYFTLRSETDLALGRAHVDRPAAHQAAFLGTQSMHPRTP